MISTLHRSIVLPLAFGAFSIIAGCGGAEETASTETGRSVEIVAREYSFTPSHIMVSPSERLTITLKNEGRQPHDLKFDLPKEDRALDRRVSPGRSETLSFTAPDKPGVYQFYSTVGDDRKKGMEGQLHVQEAEPASRGRQ